MVRRIMQQVVTDIPEHQSGKRTRGKTPEDQQEHSVKNKCERHTDAGRHNKSPCVVWIIVMDAMYDVVEPFSNPRFRFVMEDVSVDQILEQCPEKRTEQEK